MIGRILTALLGVAILVVNLFALLGLEYDGQVVMNVTPAHDHIYVHASDIDIPEYAEFVDITSTIRLEQGERSLQLWLGVIDSEQADKCPESTDIIWSNIPGITDCDGSELDYIAGGKGSGDEVVWTMTQGSYRIVAGSEVALPDDWDPSNDVTGDINIIIKFRGKINATYASILALTGGLLVGVALGGAARSKRRIVVAQKQVVQVPSAVAQQHPQHDYQQPR